MNQDDIDAAVAAILDMRPAPLKPLSARGDKEVRRQLNDYFYQKEIEAIEQEYKEDSHATTKANSQLHRADDTRSTCG